MISLERAQALISSGIEEAGRQGFKLAFAVVDASGHLVASARMDGAPWIAPDVALGKAWTAAAYGAPSAAQGEKMKELHAFSASISAATGGRFTPQIGGLPVTDGDTVIGAMGASGGTGQQDEDVVRAAIGS
ncbi:heme-binding protein [Solirubrobacter sp. CPCC 204708]|uniref:Heme-binding protein n=1 Tax=Solirubrobacter deserti TaxID=2282478 RepID=A0ABT4RH47_9ACTN|nr:heme-binding protein [Solirubrobacter deserti]MBE2315176.1 heme-binding protein [Solirubrobacter deserti]MDA0137859.1 heme-binding protein [Solirubrobacter deserti]